MSNLPHHPQPDLRRLQMLLPPRKPGDRSCQITFHARHLILLLSRHVSALLAADVQTELHVWAGGCHGFYAVVPEAAVSKAAVAARVAWVARHFQQE